ncbi:Ig-like domain-containing protein [uncultured Ruminococcus sp.]|uniref:Ig-like domain-containing protein n=1 Tax=uncultured Ruminococcus sp. TaxID=165186 RepID=UPI0025CBC4B6|nr:Ig-like domain-containing protein [uncultured Ruminococcus sp.]
MPDSTVNKKEIDRIALGSVDVYVTEWTGTSIEDIPTDDVLEVESNLIGRTKDGGEFEYQTTWYNVKSDDGKAARNDLTDDNGYMSYGMITWNGNTIEKIVSTASVTTAGAGSSAKRRTLIGGVANDNGKTYLFRAVHKDKVKGDVRYTMIGKNINGFAASYKPGQPSTITPRIQAEPFSDGHLLIIDEDNAAGVYLSTKAATVAVGSTVALTASTLPAGETVTWSSDNTSEATVSDGTVTGVAAGTVAITASITSGGSTYTDTCIVTVTGAGA